MTDHPRKPRRRATRHTIPRLDTGADPATFFTEGGTVASGFAEALAAGLDREAAVAILETPGSAPARSPGQRLKGYPPPQAEFDCHGLTAVEAEKKLHRFIAQAGRTSLRTLRVITGKGLHSPGGPVLRDMVESELRLLKKNGAIVAFRWEKKEKERSGSVIVYL